MHHRPARPTMAKMMRLTVALGGGGEFELSTAANLLLNVMGLIALVVTNRFVKKLDVMGIF